MGENCTKMPTFDKPIKFVFRHFCGVSCTLHMNIAYELKPKKLKPKVRVMNEPKNLQIHASRHLSNVWINELIYQNNNQKFLKRKIMILKWSVQILKIKRERKKGIKHLSYSFIEEYKICIWLFTMPLKYPVNGKRNKIAIAWHMCSHIRLHLVQQKRIFRIWIAYENRNETASHQNTHTHTLTYKNIPFSH